MVRNIAIIPARSGSKRIPDKNIMDFMGKPLIAHTIEAALESQIFDDVIVSTDSEKYAQISIKYGAKVPFLRDKYSDDNSTLADVMIYTLKKLDKEYDNFCSLQVSCPLRNFQIIKDTYSYFENANAATVLTCFKFGFMNPWWAFKMKDNNAADFLLSNPMQSRSQDNEDLYCPTGAVGFARVSEFRKYKSFYSENAKFFPIDWKYAVDIDNFEDVYFAASVYNSFQCSEKFAK